MRVRHTFVAAVATVVAIVAVPSAAEAELRWNEQSSQTLSIAEQNGIAPQVVVDPDGNATSIWIQQEASNRIYTAYRPAGGFFGTPQAVSPAGQTVTNPRILLLPDGGAVVAWDRVAQTQPLIRAEVVYALKPAGGSFGSPQVLSPSNESSSNPEMDTDPQGNVTFAYQTSEILTVNDRSPERLVVVERRADGNLGTRRQLWQAGNTTADEGRVDSVLIDVDDQGNALVGWSGASVTTNQDRFTARVLTAQRIGQTWQSEISLASRSSNEHVIGLDDIALRNGEAYISLTRTGSGTGVVDIHRRAAGAPAWESPKRFGSHSSVNTKAFSGGMTFDKDGNLFVTHFRSFYTPQAPTVEERRFVSLWRAPAGGAWGTGTDVTINGEAIPAALIEFDAAGNSTWLWRTDSGGTTQLKAATRTPGANGTFDATQNVGPAVDLTGGSFTLGGSSSGRAVAMWSATDGANLRVSAAFGNFPAPPPPPGESPPPPPPPPPPPEPPVPSAIQTVKPMASGQAAVFTVALSGQVDSVEWTVGGKKVTGKVVGGVLQSSVRMRPPTGAFIVGVSATGPGGTRSFSRSFSGPRKPSDDDAKAVDRGRKGSAGGVIAVGSTSALTGQSSACGPLVVASGNQTLTGCFKPIDDLDDIPTGERGVLGPLADSLNLRQSDAALMRRAVELSDGYVATGTVKINDYWPVVPSGGARIVSFPQAEALTSSRAKFSIAGHSWGPAGNAFNLNLDPAKGGSIEIGRIPRPASLNKIAGFDIVGDIDMFLAPSGIAIADTTIRLPSFINRSGQPVQIPVRLQLTPSEIRESALTVGPTDVRFGPLPIKDFAISYDPGSREWRGRGTACPGIGGCLELGGVGGGIVIKDGNLVSARANFTFDPPGRPFMPGIFIERIGAGFGLDPTRLLGNTRLSFGQFVKVDGNLVLAFPSEAAPYRMRRDEVGNAVPPAIFNTPLTRASVVASAQQILSLPVIGDTNLANGYFVYQVPGYAAFGGGIDVTVIDVIRITGSVSGEMDVPKAIYNLHGQVRACLVLISDVCGGATGNMSQGPNLAGGMGGCIQVGPVSVGGGIQWARPLPYYWPLDGCKWSPFRLIVRPAKVQAAQAGGGHTVNIKANAPSQAIKLDGAGGAPLVRVVGPNGQPLLDATDKGLDFTADGKIRILRGKDNTTTIGFQDVAPGKYRIESLPGSVGITAISGAEDPEEASAKGSVTGKGDRRTLDYEVGARPSQKVTFYDIAADGSAKEIGTTSKASGKLSWVPAPGRGLRRVAARFELNGMPAEEKNVTRFRPPSPTLARPAKLIVKRAKKNRLNVSWKRVSGAKSYEVTVTLSDGTQLFKTAKGTKLTLTKIPASQGGTVAVTGVAELREGRASTKKFKRTSSKTGGRFSDLENCTVRGKRVRCR